MLNHIELIVLRKKRQSVSYKLYIKLFVLSIHCCIFRTSPIEKHLSSTIFARVSIKVKQTLLRNGKSMKFQEPRRILFDALSRTLDLMHSLHYFYIFTLYSLNNIYELSAQPICTFILFCMCLIVFLISIQFLSIFFRVGSRKLFQKCLAFF